MQLLVFAFALTMLASISPLLTFAALWQVKEWRIDRLREHLRQEGWLVQIVGKTRLVAGILWALTIGLLLIAFQLASGEPIVFVAAIQLLLVHMFWLSVFALLAAAQLILRKQRSPVWTAKAISITATAFILTACIAAAMAYHSMQGTLLYPLLIVGQPLVVAISWLLWRPIDMILKHRILEKARKARLALPNDTIVIGITGSAGKTTTKELLSHILQDKKPLTTPAHVNTEIGVAQWLTKALQRMASVPGIIIVEMGAYRIGEIALLCKTVQPTMGIITAIGKQHIALFGSQEKLCQAKGELIESLPETGHAFLNGDSALCAEMASRTTSAVTTVGTGGTADMEAFDIEETAKGIRFRAGKTSYEVPLHGTHNVTNVLLAIAVAQQCGIQPDVIAKHLQSFRAPEHTFSIRQENGVLLLDDTHNASPASVSAAIAWARSQPAKDKALLFSGLIELGESQDHIHTEIGGAASQVFSRIIMTSKHGLAAVQKGYGKPVELHSAKTTPVQSDTLLVCIGRMPQRTINSVLPRL